MHSPDQAAHDGVGKPPEKSREMSSSPCIETPTWAGGQSRGYARPQNGRLALKFHDRHRQCGMSISCATINGESEDSWIRKCQAGSKQSILSWLRHSGRRDRLRTPGFPGVARAAYLGEETMCWAMRRPDDVRPVARGKDTRAGTPIQYLVHPGQSNTGDRTVSSQILKALRPPSSRLDVFVFTPRPFNGHGITQTDVSRIRCRGCSLGEASPTTLGYSQDFSLPCTVANPKATLSASDAAAKEHTKLHSDSHCHAHCAPATHPKAARSMSISSHRSSHIQRYQSIAHAQGRERATLRKNALS